RTTFVEGVNFGMTMVEAMPSRVECRATAWAWLPADMATTPAARSRSVSSASRLAAPRSLKAPMACRLSSLSSTCAPQAASTAGFWMLGVRSTRPWMRAAAARTSARETGIGSGERDGGDLDRPGAAGGGNLDAVAHRLAHQRLGERGGERDRARLHIGLVLADDAVGRLLLR